MSVMEVSHRSKAFVAAAQEAEQLLRELLAVPAHYRVLFLRVAQPASSRPSR